MTLDELIAAAKDQLASTDPTDGHLAADLLAKGVLELLGDAQPCGRGAFEVSHGCVNIGDSNSLEPGGDLFPKEAREIAASLLRAADEAER